jgi:hypothetical protein
VSMKYFAVFAALPWIASQISEAQDLSGKAMLSDFIHSRRAQNVFDERQFLSRLLAAFLTLLVCMSFLALVEFGTVMVPKLFEREQITTVNLLVVDQKSIVKPNQHVHAIKAHPAAAPPPKLTVLPEPRSVSPGVIFSSNAVSDKLPDLGSALDNASGSGAIASAACHISLPTSPAPLGGGTVVGFEDRATSLDRIKRTRVALHGEIDPAYADNQRVVVRLDNYSVPRALLVPKNMQVHIGDRIQAQDTYRNAMLPCNYIPNLIIFPP